MVSDFLEVVSALALEGNSKFLRQIDEMDGKLNEDLSQPSFRRRQKLGHTLALAGKTYRSVD
jgi:hypothetical protein